MFGRMINNYYYGKSGKGDFRKDDLPETRMQLFWDTLRTRLSNLFRLNLMYAVIWIPAVIVLLVNAGNVWDSLQMQSVIISYNYAEYTELAQEKNFEVGLTEEEYNAYRSGLMIYNDANYEAYLERVGDSEATLTQEQFLSYRQTMKTSLQRLEPLEQS